MFLRPHHLLCIQNYSGHGYSDAFTSHMDSVIKALSECETTAVTVVAGCDDVCAECPQSAGGTCASSDKTDAMDAAVLELCRVSYGDTAPWEALASRARRDIFMTENFNKICSGCEWFALCGGAEG